MLRPGAARKFSDYANQVFIPYNYYTITGKQVISTHHVDVLCSQPRGTSGLAPSTRENADSRMLLHLEDAVKEGLIQMYSAMGCLWKWEKFPVF